MAKGPEGPGGTGGPPGGVSPHGIAPAQAVETCSDGDRTDFTILDFQLPGVLESVPVNNQTQTKIDLAWRSTKECTKAIWDLLETSRQILPDELKVLSHIARVAIAANAAVPKRSRACEKCLVGYLGYCPIAEERVRSEGTSVRLTNRMASDFIGTTEMRVDEDEEGLAKEEAEKLERPPLDDFLDISVADIFDATFTFVSTATNAELRRGNIGQLKQDLARQYFTLLQSKILDDADSYVEPEQISMISEEELDALHKAMQQKG